MKKCTPLLLLVINTGLFGQVKQEPGKLYFADRQVDLATAKQKDFLLDYSYTPNSNLFFVAFLPRTLSRSLQLLDSGASRETLMTKGNFQFSLLVDGRLIHASNLLPGVPNQMIRDSALVLNRPLIDNINNYGSWSESFWNRFLHNGGDSALTEGKHHLRMEIRPYLETDSLRVGAIMATGEMNMLVRRNPLITLSSIRLHQPTPYEGLVVSKESYDTNQIKRLKGRIETGVFKKINGIVVISEGKLLIEEYFNGEDRNSLHDPRSVGKSFSSTLIGMAIRDGHITSEKETLGSLYGVDTFAKGGKEKARTTIEELLTMRSSFDGDDSNDQSPGNEENMYPTANWIDFVLGLPMKATVPPGQWHYFTAGVVLLGDIINRKVPGGLEAYADKRLFKPLGIHNYKWAYTPQKVPNTAGGIRMNALDFGKYGLLYKQHGKWNGKQVIPSDWIAKTFTKQVMIPNRNNENYGYLFWNKTYHVGGKDVEAFYCAGNGGNYILVFKDRPLVIVITASAYGQSYAHMQVTRMLEEYILPALD